MVSFVEKGKGGLYYLYILYFMSLDVMHLIAKPRSEKKKKVFVDYLIPRQYEIDLATKNMPHVYQNAPATTLEQVKSIDVGFI